MAAISGFLAASFCSAADMASDAVADPPPELIYSTTAPAPPVGHGVPGLLNHRQIAGAGVEDKWER